MAILLIRSDAIRLAAFFIIAGIGTVIATWVFTRYATPEHIREYLEARLHNN
jgi:hypothetical protein